MWDLFRSDLTPPKYRWEWIIRSKKKSINFGNAPSQFTKLSLNPLVTEMPMPHQSNGISSHPPTIIVCQIYDPRPKQMHVIFRPPIFRITSGINFPNLRSAPLQKLIECSNKIAKLLTRPTHYTTLLAGQIVDQLAPPGPVLGLIVRQHPINVTRHGSRTLSGSFRNAAGSSTEFAHVSWYVSVGAYKLGIAHAPYFFPSYTVTASARPPPALWLWQPGERVPLQLIKWDTIDSNQQQERQLV